MTSLHRQGKKQWIITLGDYVPLKDMTEMPTIDYLETTNLLNSGLCT